MHVDVRFKDSAIKSHGVSIIILTYNTLDLTKICIESILRYTDVLYEIILVDNASNDGSLDFALKMAAKYSHIHVIQNQKNEGFGRGNNIGAQRAIYDYLLFLNNDIEIINSNWLFLLLNILDNDPSVGIVGAKLLFPDGTLQHAGVMVVDDKKNGISISPWHIHYRGKDDEKDHCLLCQAVTGACLLIRKPLFFKLRGFDKTFWNGFEDVDLCFRLIESGYKIVYEPKSICIHHEGKSGLERQLKSDENLTYLNQKWMGKIACDAIFHRDGKLELLKGRTLSKYSF